MTSTFPFSIQGCASVHLLTGLVNLLGNLEELVIRDVLEVIPIIIFFLLSYLHFMFHFISISHHHIRISNCIFRWQFIRCSIQAKATTEIWEQGLRRLKYQELNTWRFLSLSLLVTFYLPSVLDINIKNSTLGCFLAFYHYWNFIFPLSWIGLKYQELITWMYLKI